MFNCDINARFWGGNERVAMQREHSLNIRAVSVENRNMTVNYLTGLKKVDFFFSTVSNFTWFTWFSLPVEVFL
jgi:hypothetical protein